jgi:hypothetical protein
MDHITKRAVPRFRRPLPVRADTRWTSTAELASLLSQQARSHRGGREHKIATMRTTSRLLSPGVMAATAATLLAACAPSPGSVKEKAERVLALERNDRQVFQRRGPELYAALTPAELAPARVKTYDTRTLELLFEATFVAADASDRADATPLMEAILDELYRRAFLREDLVAMLDARYVTDRDWEKARALYARFPWKGLAVPEIHESTARIEGPAVYDVSNDGRSLTLVPVDIVSRPIVVAIVSGDCHFSNDADAAIAAAPDLARALAAHTLYIDPSLQSIHLEAIAESNRASDRKLHVLYRARGWPGLDFRRTPHFYFLKDGRIVDEIVGSDPQLVALLK